MATRRDFLKLGSVSAAVLVVGVRWNDARVAAVGTFKPDAWIAIDADGVVTLTVARSEMGQGVRTALPMILAEELEADWTRIRLVQASPGPDFSDMGTGGSDSVAAGWRPLRRAGAAAREMLITAAAQTWGVDRATCQARAGVVLHAASGRKLVYGALVEAASRIAIPSDPPLKDPKDFRILGQRVKRLDGPRIVTGAAGYGLDVRVPGMLFATIVRSPVMGGKALRWDDTAAKQVPGVRGVVAVSTGVAIVADDTWAAFAGREALSITWDGGPHQDFSSAGFAKQLEDALSRPGIANRREGDAVGALAAAAKRLDAVYSYPFHAHATLEPVSYFARVEKGRCTLRGGTQNPQRVQRSVATLLGLRLDKVEVHVTLLGGGFGRRLAVDYAVEAAEVSRAVDAPVLVVWTRADDLHHGHFECASRHRMQGALDATGTPVAWLHRQACAFHNLTPPTPADLADPESYRDSAWGQYDVPYAIPHILTDYARVDCPVRIGPWRAVFSPPSSFARESFLDELAHAGGHDPLELRLRLLAAPRMLSAGRLMIDRDRYRRVLQLAAEKAGWGTPLPSGDGRHWGRGIAGNVYDGSTHLAYVAEVSVGAAGDLRVHRVVAAVDCGVPVNPLGIEGQVESGVLFGLSAALHGEISFTGGRVQQSSYADYPVMRLPESPTVEVHIVPSGERPYGMGEPPVPPAAPAVMNAIFAATGRRIRQLPLKPGELA
jgi:isoquinoline 1-oxidoreductase beta subunit